ncbi:MAG TPA: hypothetical protein VGF63_06080 [Solirubrobacteraceae bacterium]
MPATGRSTITRAHSPTSDAQLIVASRGDPQAFRGARLSAGCATVTDVAAAPDARSFVATSWQRG